jgi:integrase
LSLRASELRGLPWADIDFETKQLNLTQRADASHRIGRFKSKAAYRSIPCPPIVINALREFLNSERRFALQKKRWHRDCGALSLECCLKASQSGSGKG